MVMLCLILCYQLKKLLDTLISHIPQGLEEDIDFDWSAPVHDVIQSSISSDNAYALKMMGFDANLDGLNDLLVLEGGTTSEGNLFKFSFHEQLSTDDFIGLNPENNGELAFDEFLFSSPLRFSNEFLRIDPNLDSYLDIFAPLTEYLST